MTLSLALVGGPAERNSATSHQAGIDSSGGWMDEMAVGMLTAE